MFERIGWIVESVNVIVCLHFLYGRKINSKFATAMLIVADWFVVELISLYNLNRILILIFYFLFWVYIIFEFELNLKENILSLILVIVVNFLLQLLAGGLWALAGFIDYPDYVMLAIQLEVLAFLFVFRRVLHKLFQLLLLKNIMLFITISVFTVYIILNILQYREYEGFPINLFLPILIFGILIFAFAYFWQREKEQRQIKELELKMHNVCEASFRELIDTIRMKQHDFNNHIQTLSCQHYTIHTYEELVYEQTKYCEAINSDNRYYRLLNTTSPVISGFLYGKFMEADKQGIMIEYSVQLSRSVNNIPEFVIVEIIGILLDNAVEYVSSSKDKRINILISETESGIYISIENPISNISYDEIGEFFKKGYSKKKEHSGIGLSKISSYSDQYHLKIKAEKRTKNEIEWLKIVIETKENRYRYNSGFRIIPPGKESPQRETYKHHASA